MAVTKEEATACRAECAHMLPSAAIRQVLRRALQAVMKLLTDIYRIETQQDCGRLTLRHHLSQGSCQHPEINTDSGVSPRQCVAHPRSNLVSDIFRILLLRILNPALE